MSKEEIVEILKNLKTLSFPEQLEIIKSMSKDKTNQELILQCPEWIEWCATNKDQVL